MGKARIDVPREGATAEAIQKVRTNENIYSSFLIAIERAEISNRGQEEKFGRSRFLLYFSLLSVIPNVSVFKQF